MSGELSEYFAICFITKDDLFCPSQTAEYWWSFLSIRLQLLAS